MARLNAGTWTLADQIAQACIGMFGPLLARAVRTGIGSEACLRWGFLPMPVHYYSPVPDIRDLERRRVWERRSSLPGVDFRPEAQLSWLSRLGSEYGNECGWPPQSEGKPGQFYTENDSFSFGCAASTHAVLRHFRPKRVIEIGSGFSSMIISQALQRNRSEGPASEYTIVDPFPGALTGSWLPPEAHLVQERVEILDVDFFAALAENDVLFIDSGHTVRTGGDVNFLYLEVLPRLNRGVIVHAHDVPLPLEYPQVYFTNPRFRMFWTEAYLLQAFLCFNNAFEVLLAMGYLMRDHPDAVRAAFPRFDPQIHRLVSSSFWFRRIL